MLRKVLCRPFSSYDYDLAVVGGGPGGYVAAIKATQLGFKTACIEKRNTLGGTCLNVGCIPAKALLNSSHKYFEAARHFKQHGITYTGLTPDLPQMMSVKQESVTGLTKGIEGLFRKNKVTHVHGTGSFKDPHTLLVDGKMQLTAKNILIATGSEPAPLPGNILSIDESRVLSSTGAMALTEIPKKLAVIGAGVIGLELGSVYSRLGTEVVIIEYLDRVAPTLDIEISTHLQRILKKQGMEFMLGTKVAGGKVGSDGVRLQLEPAPSNNKEVPGSIDADYVLIAVGRKAYTKSLQLDSIGASTDKLGRIDVNEHLQTLKHSHVYAVGDCVRGPMLAHKAEEEGLFAVEHMFGKGGHLNYEVIPWVIYTMPEVAYVGKTEEDLKTANIPYSKGTFPLMANSRARANHDTDGLIKVLTHKETNRVLGCHMIGSVAGELIMEPVLGMEFSATAEEIARTCHAHPCYSEAIKEACLATFSKTINF